MEELTRPGPLESIGKRARKVRAAFRQKPGDLHRVPGKFSVKDRLSPEAEEKPSERIRRNSAYSL